MINLKKKNKVALLFSNEALTAFNWFKLPDGKKYNDILMQMYKILYEMNIGCDLVDPTSSNIEDYSLLVVPALYASSESLLERLNSFVEKGGHILYTFKSGFCNENVQVRSSHQPGIIGKACGIYYSQFSLPENVSLKGDPFQVGKENNNISSWMELITPTTAKVLAYYDHQFWGKYAAITQNSYGCGIATYIGCITSDAVLGKVLKNVLETAGLYGKDQEFHFPLITKSGINGKDKNVHYYFNYSKDSASFSYLYKLGRDLVTEEEINTNEIIKLDAWGFIIIEEN
ncbi:MAG TPA: beta-galactosidase trimerization domain-containing protein [Clostridiaceae bacterium]